MVYDNLDFLRGVEVFLNFIPAASLEAIRLGAAEIGVTKSNQAIIFDQLMVSNPLFLTGNTDTVYAMVILDLETDGPTVVEVPPGSGPGTVNDAFFRFVIDMGAPGPDKGKAASTSSFPPVTLQTGQPFPSKNNKRDKMIVNADGSVDIYFGPEAPEGKEANWIQSVPGKGCLRFSAFTASSSPGSTRPGAPERLKR
jgi:hypothetical protein